MTSRSGSHQDCSWKGSVPNLKTEVYYQINSSFPTNYKIGRGESNCANVCLLSLLPRKLPTLVCRAPHRNATCMIMCDICCCDPLPSLFWLQEDEEGVPGRGSDPEVQRLALAIRSEVNNSLIIVNFFHKIQNFRQISDLFSQI